MKNLSSHPASPARPVFARFPARFLVLAAFFLPALAFPVDLPSLVDTFLKSRTQRINSFVGRGSMTMTLYAADGSKQKSMASDITLYMKGDRCRLVTVSGTVGSIVRTELSQRGDLLTAHTPVPVDFTLPAPADGKPPVQSVTRKAPEARKLFKQWFTLGLDDVVSKYSARNSDSTTVTIDGQSVDCDRFILAGIDASANLPDLELLFNHNGFPVRMTTTPAGGQAQTVELTWQVVDGIRLTKKMKTTMALGATASAGKMESIIEWSGVLANGPVSDKEVEGR